MRVLTRYLMMVALLSSFVACSMARHVPQPILERSDRTVSDRETVTENLRTCRTEIRKAAPISIQPR